MNKIKKKISDWISVFAISFTAVAAGSMIVIYIAGVLCFPVVVIWAIYKFVTHFTN